MKLYIVATPIGNLSDMSERAVSVLREVDFIAAEDTRHTLKLLNHFGISKPMTSYFEHNRREKGEIIVKRILSGETAALVSDAGTPAISDPGEELVDLCFENHIDVIPVPGPCAAISALSACGLPTGRFCFEGFLTMNRSSRREHLQSLKNERRTLIFYEAPHKLRQTLGDLEAAFGAERAISLCRELTKLHEEVIRTTLSGARALYTAQEPRGEYVLIVAGAAPETQETPTEEQLLALVREQMAQGLSRKDAVKAVSKQTGCAKNALYDAALKAENL